MRGNRAKPLNDQEKSSAISGVPPVLELGIEASTGLGPMAFGGCQRDLHHLGDLGQGSSRLERFTDSTRVTSDTGSGSRPRDSGRPPGTPSHRSRACEPTPLSPGSSAACGRRPGSAVALRPAPFGFLETHRSHNNPDKSIPRRGFENRKPGFGVAVNASRRLSRKPSDTAGEFVSGI